MIRSIVRETLMLLVGLLLLWMGIEVLSKLATLPRPLGILKGIASLWRSGVLSHDLAVSSARWLIGWSIGFSVGVVLGLLTGRFKSARFALEGMLVISRALPFVALVPLSIRLFGLSEIGKIALVGWATCGTAWIIVHSSAAQVPNSTAWRARSLGIKNRRYFFSVLLPSLSSSVLSAIRTTLALGLIVISITEMSGVYERSSGLWWSEGLGYRLFRTLEEGRDAEMLGAIFVFGILGVLVDRLAVVLFWMLHQLGAMIAVRRGRRQQQMVGKASTTPKWPSTKRLEIRNLSASYGNINILQDVNLNIPPGHTLAILAPSGSGKTTLLRAIGGFIDHELTISVPAPLPEHEAGQDVGIVMQNAPIFGHLTVWDHVRLGNRVRSLPEGQQYAWVYRILAEFDLTALTTRFAATLSGGQQQRLAMATAVANQPELLLLDEPFANLDFLRRHSLQRFFREHVHGRVTTIFVTHDPDEALVVGDAVLVGLIGRRRHFDIVRDNRSDADGWIQSKEYEELRMQIIGALLECATVEQQGLSGG